MHTITSYVYTILTKKCKYLSLCLFYPKLNIYHSTILNASIFMIWKMHIFSQTKEKVTENQNHIIFGFR